GDTSSRTTFPTTRCTTTASSRLAARTARSRVPAETGDGQGLTKRSAEYTHERASWVHDLVHGPVGSRQDHDLRACCTGAAGARAEDRGPRRRRRADQPVEGTWLLQGGPRHEHPPDRVRR